MLGLGEIAWTQIKKSKIYESSLVGMGPTAIMFLLSHGRHAPLLLHWRCRNGAYSRCATSKLLSSEE